MHCYFMPFWDLLYKDTRNSRVVVVLSKIIPDINVDFIKDIEYATWFKVLYKKYQIFTLCHFLVNPILTNVDKMIFFLLTLGAKI